MTRKNECVNIMSTRTNECAKYLKGTVKINKLKEKGKKAKLTQVKIAKLVGISERAYQNYEYGERVPDVYTAQLIAQVLHEPVEKLFPIPDSTGIDKPDGSQKNK